MSDVAHISIMVDEILNSIANHTVLRVLDGTCGAGGHSLSILQAHPEINELVACDQDSLALSLAKVRLHEFLSKVTYVQSNFARIDCAKLSCEGLFDLILLDLGVSSMQLDTADRGFSFRFDAPLDMRMNQAQTLTAEDVVNSYPKDELARIIFEYGEERASRRIAQKIYEARRKKRITTTFELVALIEEVLPRRGKIHPATKTFQGLRIEVNQELKVLEEGIYRLSRKLAPGGVFAIISFHSLEDRIVKNAFKKLKDDGLLTLLHKKPLIPSLAEQKGNPRARSAKLRLGVRTSDDTDTE